MNDPQDPNASVPEEPANLRFLRRLVTLLTATMIIGLVTVVALLVIRLPDTSVALPENVALPDGVSAEAVTFGPTWIAVVAGDEILIFRRDSGALADRISITLPE